MESYYNILTNIKNESTEIGVIKPTRLLHGNDLSYEELSKNLQELRQLGMVMKGKGIQIVGKGNRFLEKYCKTREKIKRVGLNFS